MGGRHNTDCAAETGDPRDADLYDIACDCQKNEKASEECTEVKGEQRMINTGMKRFSAHTSEWGSLIALEENTVEVPFDIKRCYYIYGVNEGIRRGFHSHMDLEQVLICVHGSVKILVKTPFAEEVITLDSPDKGLHIGPMVWREMFDWQNEAVLLVLASKHYDEADYIRDYDEYEERAKAYFK